MANENKNETKDVAFFNAQDGVKGRDGGPYLDYEERYAAEVRRAAKEDREPAKYGENVPATVGTTLRVGALIEDNTAYSNPSRSLAPGLEQALDKDKFIQDTEGLADPVSVLPVSTGDQAPDEDADDDVSLSPGTSSSTSASGTADVEFAKTPPKKATS